MQHSRLKAHRRRKPPHGLVAEGSVLVRGEGIYYHTGGTPETGLHTVIYLHGAGGGSGWWLEQLTSSGMDSVYSVAVDLPGHGKSQGRAFTRVDEYADWLRAFLDTLALRQEVVLVGACLGGLVALEFGRRFPERLLGLVLSGTPGGRAINTERLRAAERGDDLLDYISSLFSPDADPALHDRTVRSWLKTRPEVRYADLRACLQYDPSIATGSLRLPVMLAAGTADRFGQEREVLAWGERTGAEIAWIEGAGSLCMMEKPDAFRSSLHRFLQGLEATSLPREIRYAFGGYRRTVPSPM